MIIALLVLLAVALTWVLFRDARSADETGTPVARERRDEPGGPQPEE